MMDIRKGGLEILRVSRVSEVQLGVHQRLCKDRQWDSFAITLGGVCDYYMNNGTAYRVEQGDILYLPLHANYSMDILTNDYTYIVCDFASLNEETRESFCFTAENAQTFEKLFRQLRNAFLSIEPNGMAECMSLLYRIYAQIIRESHPGYVSGSTRKKVEQVCAYIQANVASTSLTVHRLTREFQLSETHLRRMFQSMYGISPSRYIMNARIAQAKSLLGLPELTLQDVAAQSGFSSFTYFCTAFKAATGLTPTFFRQKFHSRGSHRDSERS